jgi:predicted transcriptional regulator
MAEVYDLHFELSNEDRVNILRILLMGSLNLTKISSELGLKNQEASRHLSRLEEAGLVTRNPDGTYDITHFGEICMLKHGEMDFLFKYKDYFNQHRLEDLPEDLFAKIGVLAKSNYIDDTLNALQVVKRIIEEAEEYLYRLSDQFLMVLIDPIVAATDRGVKYFFIYSADIKLPPNARETVRLRDAQRKGNFFSYTHENVKAFIVMSEKEVMLAFPNNDGNFDYKGFNSADEMVLRWCRELYEHHNLERLPPLPLWDGIP